MKKPEALEDLEVQIKVYFSWAILSPCLFAQCMSFLRWRQLNPTIFFCFVEVNSSFKCERTEALSPCLGSHYSKTCWPYSSLPYADVLGSPQNSLNYSEINKIIKKKSM